MKGFFFKMFRVFYFFVVFGGVKLCLGTFADNRVSVDTKENNQNLEPYKTRYYLPPSYEGAGEYNPHEPPEHYPPPPYYEETHQHGGYGFSASPEHHQTFRTPSRGNSHNSFGGLALKGLLIPLAGIALLGAAAALSTNPVLLQLGVINGKRKRRSINENERKSLTLPSRRV
ncbi:uncharacterized protein [Onthophagus taurus]|uniref:uncharacterized protein n=1 Tax=Onthophagus taurus TaxID=166361 RepID=UPI0039BE7F22